MDHLKEDISKILHYKDCNSPDRFMQLFNNSLISIINEHAPLKKKFVSNKPKVQWFNDTIAAEIRKSRR